MMHLYPFNPRSKAKRKLLSILTIFSKEMSLENSLIPKTSLMPIAMGLSLYLSAISYKQVARSTNKRI
jgi:hypothetical protein